MILREPQGEQVRVTFRLPSTIWAESVHLVGDFNDWSRTSHPLQRTRDGEWEISLVLNPGKSYQFSVTADPAHPYLTLASMILETNDAFLSFGPSGLRLVEPGGNPRPAAPG